MMKHSLLIGLLAISVNASAQSDLPLHAKQQLMNFKKQLKSTLISKLKSEGSLAAIEACNDQAPKIAIENSSTKLRIGRTSHKLRNTENQPQMWMKPYLEKYVSGDISKPTVVQMSNNQIGYLEPIKVGVPCLACHGTNLSPNVKTKLNQLYSKDNATGFKLGDFRGLFWVTLSK
ncbi:c-type heme family protein [Parashewanella tropica]|uniref:c-type heme family protein n=1 Tax=Parashewanella tropica TaxID=2547970 RepID=UPI00105959FF|nr:DUF3365 domain-containing protein [Parashewanella tropica]